MNYTIIIRPIIGAIIGYVTNWIAVKMMFRPLNPIKIGNWTLPFTPGIIPKNKKRIATSIGNAISANLLNEEAIKDKLLSSEMETIIREKVAQMISHWKQNEETLEQQCVKLIHQTSYDIAVAYITDSLTDSIFETIQHADLGKIIAKQIESGAVEKLNGSFLGMLGGNAIIAKLSDSVENKVNSYIQQNGHALVGDMVEEELNKISNMKISELMIKIEHSEINLVEIVMNAYQKVVLEKLSDALRIMNISKVVSDKINEMDTLELEKLLLTFMQKELNALVNLGAVIGFVLGMVNLIF